MRFLKTTFSKILFLLIFYLFAHSESYAQCEFEIVTSYPEQYDYIEVCNNTVVNFSYIQTECFGALAQWTIKELPSQRHIFTQNLPSFDYKFDRPGEYLVELILVVRGEQTLDTLGTDELYVLVLEGNVPEIYCPTIVCAGESGVYYTDIEDCTAYNWEAVNGDYFVQDNKIYVTWNTNENFGQIILKDLQNCAGICADQIIREIEIVQPTDEFLEPGVVCLWYSQNSMETYSFTIPLGHQSEISNINTTSGDLVEGIDYIVDDSRKDNGIIDLVFDASQDPCGSLILEAEVNYDFIENCPSIVSKEISVYDGQGEYNYLTYCPLEPVEIQFDIPCFTGSEIINAKITYNNTEVTYVNDINIVNGHWSVPLEYRVEQGNYRVEFMLMDPSLNEILCKRLSIYRIDAQNELDLDGEKNVCLNDIEVYTSNFNVQWVVSGGAILTPQSPTEVTVQWTGTSGQIIATPIDIEDCTNVTTLDISINEALDYHIEGPDEVCNGSLVSYHISDANLLNNSVQIESVTPSVTNVVTDVLDNENYNLSFGSSLVDYEVIVKVIADMTCNVILYDTIMVRETLNAQANVDPLIFCLGKDISLSATPTGASNYFWTITQPSTGFDEDLCTSPDNPTICSMNDDLIGKIREDADLDDPFYIRLEVEGDYFDCGDPVDLVEVYLSDELDVELSASVAGECDINDNFEGIIYLSTVLTYTNGNYVYDWYFPDGSEYRTRIPEIQGDELGTYRVCIEELDSGCRSCDELQLSCTEACSPECLEDEFPPITVDITYNIDCGNVDASVLLGGSIDSIIDQYWFYENPKGRGRQVPGDDPLSYYIDEPGVYLLSYVYFVVNDAVNICDTIWLEDGSIKFDTIRNDTCKYVNSVLVTKDFKPDFRVYPSCTQGQQTVVLVDKIKQRNGINTNPPLWDGDIGRQSMNRSRTEYFIKQSASNPITIDMEVTNPATGETCLATKEVDMDTIGDLEIKIDYRNACGDQPSYTFTPNFSDLEGAEYSWSSMEGTGGVSYSFVYNPITTGMHWVSLEYTSPIGCTIKDSIFFEVEIFNPIYSITESPILQCADTIGWNVCVVDNNIWISWPYEIVGIQWEQDGVGYIGDADAFYSGFPPYFTVWCFDVYDTDDYDILIEHSNGCVNNVEREIEVPDDGINPGNDFPYIPDTIEICQTVRGSLFAFNLNDITGGPLSNDIERIVNAGCDHDVINSFVRVDNLPGTCDFIITLEKDSAICATYLVHLIIHPRPADPILIDEVTVCKTNPDVVVTATNYNSDFIINWNWFGTSGANNTVPPNQYQIQSLLSGRIGAYYTNIQTGCRSVYTSMDLSAPDYFSGFPVGCYDFCNSDLPITLESPTDETFDYWEYRNYTVPDDNTNWNTLLSGTGLVNDLIISNPLDGKITLYTEIDGCTYESEAFCPIFFDCDSCAIDFIVEDQLCLVDEDKIMFNLVVMNGSS